MGAYLLRRCLMTLPTLLIVAMIVFLLMRLVPGDPVSVMVGDMADPATIAAITRNLGLDQPLPVQFLRWLGNILTGDFGTSITTGEAVLPAMLHRLGVTAQIVLISMALAMLIAVPAGMLAAWRQNKGTDMVITGLLVLFISVPSFWVGLLLILLFGVQLGWLPTVGYVAITDDPVQGLLYLILPCASLVLVEMGVVARMMRSGMIDVLRLDYITHARAKGLAEGPVLWRHAFPNAFAPTLTFIGLLLGSLLGGAVVIETVFTLPGLGRFLVDAIEARDYPVIQGCLLLVALIRILVNLAVDLAYPLLDPRVQL